MTHRWHRLQTRFGMVAFPEKTPPARVILRCDPIWVVTHARRHAHDDADADEEVRARLVATKAAIEQIDALAGEEWTRDETVERMRALYEYRKRRFAARAGKIEDEGYEDRSLAY